MLMPSLSKLQLTAAFTGLLLVGIAGWSAPAGAVITHDFEGTCNTGCAEIGLSLGDPVFASFDFLDSSVLAGAVLGRADVDSFVIDFGIVKFNSATASGFDLAGNVAPDLSVNIDSFVTSGLAPSNISYVISIDSVSWDASIGECLDSACATVQTSQSVAAIFTLATAPRVSPFIVSNTVVPEPASMSLFVIGLLFGLVMFYRRHVSRLTA